MAQYGKFEPSTSQIYTYHGGFLSELINTLRFSSIAEIGVAYGDLASTLLRNCSCIRRYYLIDRWLRYPEKWRYADSLSQQPQEFWDNMFAKMWIKIHPFKRKTCILKMASLRAANCLADESLDLVYIDALHHFHPVFYDIQAWWPKIKPTGILAGHDWWDEGTRYAQGMIGVMAAVLTMFPREAIHVGQPAANWDHAWYVWKADGINGPWRAGRR